MFKYQRDRENESVAAKIGPRTKKQESDQSVWGEQKGEGVDEVGGAVVATMVDRLGGHREIHREIYVKLDQHMEIHREIHKLYQHRTALHHAAVHWWGRDGQLS